MANRIAPLVRPQDVAPRTLAEVANQWGMDASPTISITGVTMDSRDVHPGDLYFALPGDHTHGAMFAEQAVAAGAVAVVVDPTGQQLVATLKVPVLVRDHPRLDLGPLSAWFYGNDDDGTTKIGVTGTNGKTSTVYFMEAMLQHAGHRTGLSTTVERHVGNDIIGSALTTPEASQLQALIAKMRELGAEDLLLEVSAQAVSRHRIDGTHFQAVGFTNLSPEHLDEYPDMEAYYAAKRGLFTPELADRAIVSIASSWGRRLARDATIPVETIGDDADADWRVDIHHRHPEGANLTLHSPSKVAYEIVVGVPGDHMALNAALAVALLASVGIPDAAIHAALADHVLERVYLPGRMELMSGPGAPTFYVDYAHTPDALDRTLEGLRKIARGRIILILGADGGRDPYKRPDMGIAAARGADILIINDINPRFEDPGAIRAVLRDAARSVPHGAEVLEVGDPATAIRTAVELARSDDTIIVCGPGDENYHEVRGVQLPYSARGAAREALREAGYATSIPRRAS